MIPLARQLYATLFRYTLGVLALTLPIALFAQLTRALPLLYAARPAHGDTATLVACALGLLGIALVPPALCVSAAGVCARLSESGGLRALAAHGLSRAHTVRVFRIPALVAMLSVGSLGVFVEPPIAALAREKVSALAARGTLGILTRGGQVEPLAGVVMAAPQGARGPLYLAKTTGIQVFLRAQSFSASFDRGLLVELRGVLVRSPGTHLRATRVLFALGEPAPDESLMAAELSAKVSTHDLRALRRHAARALWGVSAFLSVLLSASISLSPRLTDPWRVPVASALSLSVMVLFTRLAWALLTLTGTASGIARATLAIALCTLVATEWALRRR